MDAGAARRSARSDAFDASLTSPPPVKPGAVKEEREADAATVRRRATRVRQPAAHERRSASPPCGAPRGRCNPCRGADRWRSCRPARSALISRTRTGSRPRRSAMRSMWTSVANCDCGAPNPRNAPFGGVLVIVARRANANVIAAIRAARVNHPARQHDGAERGVGAAVEHGVDVDRGQASVARHAGAVADHRRMALRRRQHVLDAVVDQLDRTPRLARQQRRVTRRSSTGTLPCRRSRRRFPSGRRALSRRGDRGRTFNARCT